MNKDTIHFQDFWGGGGGGKFQGPPLLYETLPRVYELIHPRVYGCLGVHEYCTMWFSFEVWLHHSTRNFTRMCFIVLKNVGMHKINVSVRY